MVGKNPNAVVDAPYDMLSVWYIVNQVYNGSQTIMELMMRAISNPESLTLFEIFEIGRITERLCGFAADMKTGEDTDAADVKYFTQCRNYMHAVQYRIDKLSK